MARPSTPTASKRTTPQVHEELSGFSIHVNEFGEIVSNLDVHKLNDFLDRNTEDKKFRGVDVQRVRPDADDNTPIEQVWGQ
jgi:hypothetical protein